VVVITKQNREKNWEKGHAGNLPRHNRNCCSFGLRIIAAQCRLVVLDENISNAMSQIEVQLSNRFDVLVALLDLTKGSA